MIMQKVVVDNVAGKAVLDNLIYRAGLLGNASIQELV
jgi:hypothetical protein